MEYLEKLEYNKILEKLASYCHLEASKKEALELKPYIEIHEIRKRLEETTEASMIDAVDTSYYRLSGVLRMDREKFVESFVRRFAENVNRDRNYKIRILDLNETPPKVSVQIGSNTVATFAGEDFDIVNKIDAILETKYEEDRLLKNVNE